jgi:ankyrin repeat protein
MDVPLGIYTDIINYLEPANILLLSRTCKQLYNIVFIDLVNIRILTNKMIGSENSGKYNFKDIPIEYFEKYNINKITKYIIDLTADLECVCNNQWKPIHIICRYSTPEMIKYIVDKGVNLECEINDKWKPIHYICRYSTPEMIKYIIDKGINLECENNEKWKPIHFICQYSTPEMIKYIIDKGVNLECETDIKWKPIHFICRCSTSEMIKYIVDKGCNINSKIEKYNYRTKKNCGCVDLISLNKTLNDSEKTELIDLLK